MLKKLRHSLSARLMLLFAAAGIALLISVSLIMGHGFSRHFRQNIQPFLAHYSQLLQLELGNPPDRQRARQITRRLPADIYVYGPDDQWSTSTKPFDPDSLRPFSPSQRHKSDHRRRAPMRFLNNNDDLVIHTRSGPHDIYFKLNNHRSVKKGGPFGLIVLGIIATVLLMVYLATRSLFKPVREIRSGVQRIGNGELDHRIAKFRNDELGELTDSVNAMAEDIHGMLEAKRELLLAISHELRSPLTRSKVNLALLEDSRTKDEISKDIQQMEELICELLESERLNSRFAKLQTESADLGQLISELVKDEFTQQKINLRLPQPPVIANLDPVRIKLLLRNLLNNAIKHSGTDSQPPEVELSKAGHKLNLSVIDHGRGIDPSHIPHLTEPFYRADPSRQRKTGGYGLGLYLCRMIAQAHGGEISIESELGKGTRIDCVFPLG